MNFEVVGIRFVDFTKDGRRIVGSSVYGIIKDDTGLDEGHETDKIFVPEAKLPEGSFRVGDTLIVGYDRKGKIVYVTVADDTDAEIDLG